jgi:hypothetical protein
MTPYSAPSLPGKARARVAAFAAFAAALVTLVGISPARAQGSTNQQPMAQKATGEMTNPPDVLVIFREEVKPGRASSHEKLEADFAKAYSHSTWGNHYLGLTSVSGPPEAWFLEPCNSLDAVEKELVEGNRATGPVKTELDQLSARESGELSSQREMIAFYREDLSMNAASDLPHKRYVVVTTYRVRPGHAIEFMEAAKLVRATYQKAGTDRHWATYEVRTGAPGGTFLVIQPIEKLSEFAPDPSVEKAFNQALGSDVEKLMKLESEAVATSETQLLAFDPKMSFVPERFAMADPAFWKPGETTIAKVGTSGRTKTAPKKQK